MINALFDQFAAYNRWANARLYAAALALPDADYRRPIGLFFGSLHGTLNHILVADRLWMLRLAGESLQGYRLDTIVHEDRAELARARAAEDDRLATTVAGYDAADFARTIEYRTTGGEAHGQSLGDVLQHIFNHQTHHRGQAHAGLSLLTGAEPPPLDLLAFQRGAPAPDLRAVARAA